MEPGFCALQDRLRQVEALLAREAASPVKTTDWAELCYICGRRCWL